jgi:hypothetical protein
MHGRNCIMSRRQGQRIFLLAVTVVIFLNSAARGFRAYPILECFLVEFSLLVSHSDISCATALFRQKRRDCAPETRHDDPVSIIIIVTHIKIGTVTRLGAGHLKHGSCRAGPSSLLDSSDRLWAHAASYTMGTGEKQTGHEPIHSPPSAFMALCLN